VGARGAADEGLLSIAGRERAFFQGIRGAVVAIAIFTSLLQLLGCDFATFVQAKDQWLVL
jgi:hypothetical protein